MSRLMAAAACLVALLAPCVSAAPFDPNNLAVLRVGSGAAALSNACTEVFIDEYDVFGALQQTIALPTATVGAQRRFCLSGTATSEGMLTRSADGSVLLVGGYDAALGTASVSSAAGIPRVVAVIRQDGTIDTSTAFTDGFSNNSFRSVASDDGTRFWLTGTGTGGGVRYIAALGATTSTLVSSTITNTRVAQVFGDALGDRLYVSSQSGAFRLSTVGSGLPTTTGQALSNLPGLPTATSSPYQFQFGDYDFGVIGFDVLYVANDDATGVQKWSLVGGTWVSNGSIGVAADAYRGMTQYGDSLYLTGRAGGVGVIRRIDDPAGYNGALAGAPVTLVTATANRVFQGIALTPEPPPPPPVTIADASVTEGNPPGTTTLTFTATIPAPIADNCTFSVENFGTPPGTPATAGVDYVFPNPDPQVTIPAGQTSATFDVTIVRDTLIEGDEQFVLSAYGEPSACDIFGMGDIIATIIDDDAAAPPDISIDDVSLAEGNAGTTVATLTVSLSAPAPAGGVTVNYATADGTATTALVDYTAASGTLNFIPGDASETITVNLTGDAFFEANETLFVNLSGAVGGNITDGQGQLTIQNDDAMPQLLTASPTVIEGTGAGSTNAVFTVTLTGAPAPGGAVTVDFASAAGSAISGTDFTAANGTLTFTNGGALTQDISVPITRDNIDEDDESFTVGLSNAVNAQIEVSPGTATIQDDDTAVVSINNVSQNEGNAGAAPMNFTVSLSVPASSSRFFGAFTADGTAQQPADYIALPLGPTTVVFAPGEISKIVPVQINGDTLVEADETFTLNLAEAASIERGTPQPVASGTGTIVNDDVPSVSIGDASVTEGTGAGSTNAVFTVTLSEQPLAGSPVTVNYATTSITAISGTDFTATSGALTFNNGGALTQTISVPITRDNIDEDDELFALDILASGANVTDGKGEGSILDDDTAVVSINNVSQNEGNAGTSNFVFTLSLSTPSASTLEYSVYTTDGSASAGSDYVGIPAPGNTVVFPPLSTTQTVTVTVNGDSTVEADETFNALVLFALPVIEGGPTPVATGVGTIVNDDVAVNLGINDVSVTEGTGAGSTNAVFTVTLSAQPPVGAPVTVNYATAGGSATSGTDFTAASGTLTFNNGGALTQTVSVPVTRDNIDENDEGFVVNLTATGGTVTDAQGAGTILDDDAVPTPSIGNISVAEGNSGQTTATFTITLSNPSSFALNYQASTADGSAVAPGDYQAIATGLTNVSFAPLQTTQTISVNVVGELLVEANESFVLNLRAAVPTDGLPAILASGTATINNDDSATLSIVGSSGPEGNAGTTPRQFTATLSNPVQAQVQVNYATADGSATVADNDYQAASGTLTFPGSTLTQTLNVNVVGDLEVEADQSFVVNLSGLNAPAGVTLGTATATGTIVNDDSTSFSITGASVTEGTGANSTLSFTVSLSAPAKDPVSVQYSTVSGSANAPADYTAASGTLTFNGGQTTQTIAVTVIGDNLVEPDESLSVNLSNASGASITVANATGSIINDDNAVLSITDVTLPEGNGNGTTPFVFTISSSNPSTAAITVNYQTSDGTAAAPNDFAAMNGSVTIPALATSVTLTVPVVADNVQEPDETFTLTLSGAQGATIGDATGVGTILGDDELIAVPALDPRSLGLLIALMLALGMVGVARRR